MGSKQLMRTRRQFVKASAVGLAVATISASASLTWSLDSPSSERPTASRPARVIIDTDPGVDDAFALLLAMRSPELKIEAITAVAGNVPLEITLPNALRMIEISGRTDIPVAAGGQSAFATEISERGLRAWQQWFRWSCFPRSEGQAR